jgi:ketosteroid isomerase-like protein
VLDRETVLKTIDAAYAARASGDKDAVNRFWASGANFRLAGEPSLLPTFPAAEEDPVQAVAKLVELVSFHGHERIDAVVEGNNAAVRWRATLSIKGHEPITTELYDLWKLDDEGKVISLVQFADTALLRDRLT